MRIGERILEARKAAGLTQRALADAIGVSVQAVSQWETGKSDIAFERIQSVADLLRVDFLWLLRGASKKQLSKLELLEIPRQQARGEPFPVIELREVLSFFRKEFQTGADTVFEQPTNGLIWKGSLFGVSAASIDVTVEGLFVFDTSSAPIPGAIVIVASLQGDFVHANLADVDSSRVVARRLTDDFKLARLVGQTDKLNPQFPSSETATISEFAVIIGSLVESRIFPRNSGQVGYVRAYGSSVD